MSRPDELTENEALILGILREHARGLHGTAIIDELTERSEGHFQLAFGTLYPAMKRLEAKGFVEGVWEDYDSAAAEARPRRRYWKLTALGSKALDEAARLWALKLKILGQPT
jgi:PadR family transcriptional regulator, regulatory protein PadR